MLQLTSRTGCTGNTQRCGHLLSTLLPLHQLVHCYPGHLVLRFHGTWVTSHDSSASATAPALQVWHSKHIPSSPGCVLGVALKANVHGLNFYIFFSLFKVFLTFKEFFYFFLL